ncbi:MAG: PilZ domain-containing protein [Bdellovibrionota bacterium]
MGVRKYARTNIPAKAFISINGSLKVAKVTDVSAGGVLIQTREYLAVGTEVDVLISANGISASFIGEVIRQTDDGVALRMRSNHAPNPLSKLLMSA